MTSPSIASLCGHIFAKRVTILVSRLFRPLLVVPDPHAKKMKGLVECRGVDIMLAMDCGAAAIGPAELNLHEVYQTFVM